MDTSAVPPSFCRNIDYVGTDAQNCSSSAEIACKSRKLPDTADVFLTEPSQ